MSVIKLDLVKIVINSNKYRKWLGIYSRGLLVILTWRESLGNLLVLYYKYSDVWSNTTTKRIEKLST